MKTPYIGDDPELERFKTSINLSEFAAWKGFVKLDDKSSSNSVCMSNGNVRIVITRTVNSHWIYFKVLRSDSDVKESGTIIDFIQNRSNLNIGQIRKLLRPWLGFSKRPKLNPKSFVRNIKPLKRNDIDLLEAYHNLKSISETNVVSRYLVSERKIPEEIIYHTRFKDRIRSDKYNNAIFPHFYYSKVVGWEIKNFKFTGFPSNSTKSIWFSNRFDGDNCLIICESAIDLLSFYALFPEHLKNSWGISTAGSWGTFTEEMIVKAIGIIPVQSVIIAFDNDTPGEYFKNNIINILETEYHDIDFSISTPILNDWNADLKSNHL